MNTALSLLPVVEAGRVAAIDGRLLADCPYSALTEKPKAIAWVGGFRYGQMIEGATPMVWEVEAVEGKSAKWESGRHPRDQHGRFIKIGDLVSLSDGRTGTVTGISGGKVDVATHGGQQVSIDPHDASVSKQAVTPLGDDATAAAKRFVQGLGGPLDAKRLDNYSARGYKESTLDPHWDYTAAQRDAIHDYTASNVYREVNGRLRNGDDSSPEVAVIDSAMRGIPEDVELHRAVSTDVGAQLAEMPPGTVIEDPAYSSTSLLEGNYVLAAGEQSMRLVILAPKGTPAVWASPVADDYSEYEMLLQRNQRFVVLKSQPAGPSGSPPGRVWLLAIPTEDRGSGEG